jgi:hypothetical protein
MKDITSLRNHLFDALNRLADASPDDLEHEIEKASSMVQVAETIIKTAEVENQFIAITKGFGSGFIPVLKEQPSVFQLIKGKAEEMKKNNDDLFDVNKEKNWVANGE